MKVLLTGIAGFIGFHTANRLLSEGYEVIGIDNINDYYDQSLKLARLSTLGINDIKDGIEIKSTPNPSLFFYKIDLEDQDLLNQIFEKYKPDYVINLAAQAGVRYSLENPGSYISRNIIGFFNILENSRNHNVKHLVYASSSSVYGLNRKYPFNEDDNTDHPASLYAATKKSNEAMAHSYSNLFHIPTTGLRFFTVYGPWGRPDMIAFKIADAIANDKTIDLYDNGNLWRDYTYVEDIVEGIFRVMKSLPQSNAEWDAVQSNSANSSAPYRVLNIGHGAPVKNIDFVQAIEKAFNKRVKYNDVKAPETEVFKTYADTTKLAKLVDYKPKTTVEEGLKRFVEWYKNYYKLKN